MKIELPFKTLTVNHLYGHHGFRKFLMPEAKKLRKEIESKVLDMNLDVRNLKDKKLKVEIDIYENWLTKAGTVRKKDLANREKFLIDSVFNTIGIDDKFIYEINMRKIQSEQEKFIITICEQ